jgi:hypothetical protein
MKKAVATVLVALSVLAAAAPASAQFAGPECWYAFKKNKPLCKEEARDDARRAYNNDLNNNGIPDRVSVGGSFKPNPADKKTRR